MTLTVSIGIAVQIVGEQHETASIVQALVDGTGSAMYRAKCNGRNRVEEFE